MPLRNIHSFLKPGMENLITYYSISKARISFGYLYV